jgi:hypothetical protein
MNYRRITPEGAVRSCAARQRVRLPHPPSPRRNGCWSPCRRQRPHRHCLRIHVFPFAMRLQSTPGSSRHPATISNGMGSEQARRVIQLPDRFRQTAPGGTRHSSRPEPPGVDLFPSLRGGVHLECDHDSRTLWNAFA